MKSRKRYVSYTPNHVELFPAVEGLPFSLDASRTIMGHWDGRYYPASLSGPEEWPEFEETAVEWEIDGYALEKDSDYLDGENMSAEMKAACLAWLNSWHESHPYEPTAFDDVDGDDREAPDD